MGKYFSETLRDFKWKLTNYSDYKYYKLLYYQFHRIISRKSKFQNNLQINQSIVQLCLPTIINLCYFPYNIFHGFAFKLT